MKEIKEFENFEGQDGYLIVDGIDAQTPGGKKLLSDIIPSVPVTDVKIGNTTIVSDGVATIPENKTVPDITGASENDVLTVSGGNTVWAPAQGGGSGGFSYTKVTGTFGAKYEAPFPGEDFNKVTRDLEVSNHTYTVVPENVDFDGGYDTQVVKVKLALSDFPDTYVQFKTCSGPYQSLRHIVVYNGTTELIRLYDAGAINNGAVYEVQAYLEGDTIEVDAPSGWDERFPGGEKTILIRVFGDTYTIYCSASTMYNGNAE